MTVHMMVDLETLGVVPGSVILSVGAVTWTDDARVTFRDALYIRVETLSCLLAGMTVSQDTVQWWAGQAAENPSALDSLRAEAPVPLQQALEALADLWRNSGAECLWANGAAADPVWLEDAYRRCDMTIPWRHSQVRCYRTVMAISGIPREEWVAPDIEHDAFQDACAQMKNLRVALSRLGPWRELEMARIKANEPMDVLRMDWLGSKTNHGLNVAWDSASDPDQCVWVVTKRNGGVNDREYSILGTGLSIREAVDMAIKKETQT